MFTYAQLSLPEAASDRIEELLAAYQPAPDEAELDEAEATTHG